VYVAVAQTPKEKDVDPKKLSMSSNYVAIGNNQMVLPTDLPRQRVGGMRGGLVRCIPQSGNLTLPAPVMLATGAEKDFDCALGHGVPRPAIHRPNCGKLVKSGMTKLAETVVRQAKFVRFRYTCGDNWIGNISSAYLSDDLGTQQIRMLSSGRLRIIHYATASDIDFTGYLVPLILHFVENANQRNYAFSFVSESTNGKGRLTGIGP
jgi:hypothetical protein